MRAQRITVKSSLNWVRPPLTESSIVRLYSAFQEHVHGQPLCDTVWQDYTLNLGTNSDVKECQNVIFCYLMLPWLLFLKDLSFKDSLTYFELLSLPLPDCAINILLQFSSIVGFYTPLCSIKISLFELNDLKYNCGWIFLKYLASFLPADDVLWGYVQCLEIRGLASHLHHFLPEDLNVSFFVGCCYLYAPVLGHLHNNLNGKLPDLKLLGMCKRGTSFMDQQPHFDDAPFDLLKGWNCVTIKKNLLALCTWILTFYFELGGLMMT